MNVKLIVPASLFVAALALLIGQANQPRDITDLPACQYEDTPGPCYWDAAAQGNGQGDSFWVDANQEVHYLP